MPVVAAIDQHEDPPGVEHAHAVIARPGQLRQAEPEHVHRRTDGSQWETGPKKRIAPVGGDHQPRANRLAPVRPHPDDAPALLDQRLARALLVECEVGITPRLASDEIEKLPLRHQRDVRRRYVEVPEIDQLHVAPGNAPAQFLDLLVRPGEQGREQAELVEQPQRRGVDGVAAEIAQEVGVFFQHDALHAGPGQQKAGDHARRAAADDNDIDLRHRLTKPRPAAKVWAWHWGSTTRGSATRW